MKFNFLIAFFSACFLTIGSVSAQVEIDFSFKIWRNSVTPANYLGTFNGSTDNATQIITTSPITQQVCPGDQLIIQQFCYKNGSQHNFDGSVPGSKGQISIGGSNTFGASVTLIADICPSGGGSGCSTSPVHFPTWSWGSSITITVPPVNYTTPYLVFSSSIIGNSVHPYNCGIRTAFVPLNLAPSTSVADQTICPGDAVTIPTASGFTYSNWSPSNPNITAPTVTTNYTVDITHTTGCTTTDAFTIRVSNPDVELSMPNQLCYNQSTQFTQNDYDALYGNSTTPLSLTVNGAVIFDANANVFNFPYLLDGPTTGAGTYTFEYTYSKNGLTCTKTYEMIIHPEIVLNMQSAYAFCNSNFQPIFATSGGIVGQPGITYIWTQFGVPFSVGTGPYFTPSSYGTYTVRAYDEFGCEVRHTFTVYDPGVGIKHPANITYCSLTERGPSYVGWHSDPFGPIRYSFDWTYTDENGTTVSIANSGPGYQVPYLGPGTYTAVVNANGCTETISITVTDLLQVYNNHGNAAFSFTPLFGNQVSCQPNVSMSGVNDIWTVVDEFGTTISTAPYGSGIRFSYTTGVEYTVTLRRESPSHCQVFVNQFTWLDNFRKVRREQVSNDNNSLNFEPTSVETFPNPTTGLVNVQLKNAETSETSIQVLNTLGQIVIEKQVQDTNTIEIDLSKEISGMYILHIVNGSTQLTEKIIKE
ncbi:T9SS type A sorting domain-containing protein [Aureispira sp. CCB-QB1]|uniref:T9SS type A sorting domain-containing protein n=1 Tax=Aureispira sp. CCB-QB1 TaxID=1313421 RepID=UPI000696CC57|nr:T9SS type A sorting domain-containing protein [Aureispira sp. CCB-QB1]